MKKQLYFMRALCLALIVPIASAAAQQPTVTQADKSKPVEREETLRIETALVTLPVIVMDRDSKFIPHLRATDFEVFDENIRQEVSFFASTEEPLTVVLMLDVSDSTEKYLSQIQRAAMTFTEQLGERDQVLVAEFDGGLRILTEAVSDRTKIHQAIAAARTGGGTRFYDALDFILRERMRRVRGRKAVVIFTDGIDTGSKTTDQQLLRLVEETDAFVYPIEFRPESDTVGAIGGTNGGPAMMNPSTNYRGNYAKADTFLRMLAKASGARFQMAGSPGSMARSFAAIADELKKQYVIGYYPNMTTKPGQRHKLKVRVTRQNAVVRTRSSYYSSGETSTK